ncbi:MAG: putative manganese-dependent inorganic diphosphatase [Fusobacteriaceae bacterium]|jgi:manganese-dependent inorganic pyrophosphatase|nr:putative manganese-dependent inorganic diphosphatase [Fusobacteriaceae bacterium]
MEPVYVFGHKNPDTDSICSAIAMANLQNKLGVPAIPCRLGDMNRETKFALQKFDVPEPRLLKTVSAQISDLTNVQKSFISENDSLRTALEKLTAANFSSLPVGDRNDKLKGMLHVSEIANTYLNLDHSKLFKKYVTTYENLMTAIDGVVLSGVYPSGVIGGNLKEISEIERVQRGDIVLMAPIEEAIDSCVGAGARVIIVACDENDHVLPRNDIETAIVIVRSSLFKIVGRIGQSISVSSILSGDSFYSFKKDDFLHDIRDMMKEANQTNFPVAESDGRVYGTIRTKDLINFNRKKVILVDHNEKNQSVDGIEDAKILRVIDHHKFGNFMTEEPLNITAEIVGSTCTIIYEMYKDYEIELDRQMAGVLLSGILSDTLLLKSPTCTEKDVLAIKDLEKICKIKNYKFYGMDLLKAGTSASSMTVHEILTQDLKEFPIKDHVYGVAQINTVDSQSILERKAELEREMEKLIAEFGFSLFILVITDIIKSGSYALVAGENPAILELALDVKLENNMVWLPGVISRKKQIMPFIMSASQNYGARN